MSEIREMTWHSWRERDYFGEIRAHLSVNGFMLGKVEHHDRPLEGHPKNVLWWGFVAGYQDDNGRPNGTHCVGQFATEEEAKAAVEQRFREILPSWLDCGECGAPNNPDGYVAALAKHLREQNVCFGCDFWRKRVAEDAADGRGIVASGRHYQIGDESEVEGARRRNGGWGLGCGGTEFTVEYLADGRRVVTHNLWVQGLVPPHFRERLPDNARFIEKGKESVSYPFVGEPHVRGGARGL